MFSRATSSLPSTLSTTFHSISVRPHHIKRSGRMLFALLHSKADPALPTFHFQSALPRLPVPPLRQTLDNYLRSLEPFLLFQQQSGGEGAAGARTRRQKWALDFEKRVGALCQQRLLELQKNAPYNWLDDLFWLRKAYLEGRYSLLVHSNWWLALQDDPMVPASVRLSDKPEAFNDWQLRRAAWVTKRMLEFKHRIDDQKIPPDMARSTPLCMAHYKRMFNMTRIPQTDCDILHKASPSHPAARQILVFVQDHMFLINVLHPNGKFVGVNALVQNLRECVQSALSAGRAIPLGILTADNRDIWARNRERLSELSVTNIENLLDIDSSLFSLSLDGTTSRESLLGVKDEFTNPRWDDHLHNTAYGQSGHNRWFDKTISISIESNARFGMMGEHSPCDALVPSELGNYCVEQAIDPTEFQEKGSEMIEGSWRKLDWKVDEKLLSECERVSNDAQQLIMDSDDSQLWFSGYGIDWIRQIAKLSPDAYIQMALQLAWMKDQGKPTAIYETASTRFFLHGRTDVIRSFSKESLLFVQSMMDERATQRERLSLLTAAVKAHNHCTRSASTGQGIDRHLMALRLVMTPDETAELFQDDLFSLSQEWKLSTSGLSSGDRFIGTGFGSPYTDGYGVNYLPGANILKFGIESKRSSPSTSTHAFKRAIVEALHDLRLICEEGMAESSYTVSSNNEEQIQARL